MASSITAAIPILISASALGISLRREWLERSRLDVVAAPNVDPTSRKGELLFTIENRGSRGVTVGEVGAEFSADGAVPAHLDIEHGGIEAQSRSARSRIEPGGFLELTVSVHYPAIWHVDVPMRPFAQHRDKRTYGKTFVPFRELLLSGWKPPKPIPSELYEPADPPLATDPVEPRWKFWKPERLRRADTGWASNPPPWVLYDVLGGTPQGRPDFGELQ
jgi:hypothetical protein